MNFKNTYFELLNASLKLDNAKLEVYGTRNDFELSNIKLIKTDEKRVVILTLGAKVFNTASMNYNDERLFNAYLHGKDTEILLTIRDTLSRDSAYKVFSMDNNYFFADDAILKLSTNHSNGDLLFNVMQPQNWYDVVRGLIEVFDRVIEKDYEIKPIALDYSKDLYESILASDNLQCADENKNVVFVVRDNVYYGHFKLSDTQDKISDAPDAFDRCNATNYLMTGLRNGFNERFYAHTGVVIRLYKERYVAECDACGVYFSKEKGNLCDRCVRTLKNLTDDENEIKNFKHDKYSIKSYDHKPTPIFVKDDADQKPLYLGVENEVDTYTEYDEESDEYNGPYSSNEHKLHADFILQKISKNGYVYAKNDGSLNSGFEMVSHPITLENHYKLNWEVGMKALTKLGYSSHNVGTCGLHIHINRDFFGSTTNAQMLGGAKIAYLMEKNWDDFVKFTRRKSGDLRRWANLQTGVISRYERTLELHKAQNSIPTLDDKKYALRQAFKNAYENGDKYVALNTNHSKTFELRVFRGTLNYNTFMATLQFVDNLARYAKKVSFDKLVKTTFADIVNFKRHDKLHAYWNFRNGAVNYEEVQNGQ